jgi:hypothetical protein
MELLSRIAVGQMLASALLATLERSMRVDPVIDSLERLRDSGNDLGAAQLELLNHARQSASGQAPPLVKTQLTHAETLRYWSTTPMLITTLVNAQDPRAVAAISQALETYAEANVDGTGPLYAEALRMLKEADVLGQAAAQANRAFGI